MRDLAWAIRVQRVNVSESYKQLGELSSGKGKGTAMARNSWCNYSLPLCLPPRRSCACSVQPQFWAGGTDFQLQLLHRPPPFTTLCWKTPHHVIQHILVSGLHVLILHKHSRSLSAAMLENVATAFVAEMTPRAVKEVVHSNSTQLGWENKAVRTQPWPCSPISTPHAAAYTHDLPTRQQYFLTLAPPILVHNR